MVVKHPFANAGDMGSIPGLGRYPGEEKLQPTPILLPGNPTDRGAWWATVHGVSKESYTIERLNNNKVISSGVFRFIMAKRENKH